MADGMCQTDAYKSAYNTKKMSDQVIWNKASELANKGELEVRIRELKSKIEKKQLWTREQSVKVLSSIALSKSALSKNTDKVAAIRELNLMHGFNSAAGNLDDYVLPVRIVREVVDGRKVSVNQTAK